MALAVPLVGGKRRTSKPTSPCHRTDTAARLYVEWQGPTTGVHRSPRASDGVLPSGAVLLRWSPGCTCECQDGWQQQIALCQVVRGLKRTRDGKDESGS